MVHYGTLYGIFILVVPGLVLRSFPKLPAHCTSIPSMALIPRPHKNDLVSLKRAMQLQNDHERFKDVTRHLRQNIGRMLKPNIHWAEQDLDTKMAYIRRVVETYPFLKRYEGAWPVIVFTQRRLGGAVHAHRQKLLKASKDKEKSKLQDNLQHPLRARSSTPGPSRGSQPLQVVVELATKVHVYNHCGPRELSKSGME
ncbi:hypothetical protein A0H81_09492 [Grifola frondosa]|uniref:Uncharacterized protein n=1 Tax=Grifola frondosa TaxID=5627 RepID=A0A1C7LL02_GRIFR|nr:hypothetical protein A0H81_14797 [Grifola frondosa]OBZ70996.1 hypothetical protein A0H81_09492 [Grifola frondosa]